MGTNCARIADDRLRKKCALRNWADNAAFPLRAHFIKMTRYRRNIFKFAIIPTIHVEMVKIKSELSIRVT